MESAKVLHLDPFNDMGTPVEIINNVFGGKDKLRKRHPGTGAGVV